MSKQQFIRGKLCNPQNILVSNPQKRKEVLLVQPIPGHLNMGVPMWPGSHHLVWTEISRGEHKKQLIENYHHSIAGMWTWTRDLRGTLLQQYHGPWSSRCLINWSTQKGRLGFCQICQHLLMVPNWTTQLLGGTIYRLHIHPLAGAVMSWVTRYSLLFKSKLEVVIAVHWETR